MGDVTLRLAFVSVLSFAAGVAFRDQAQGWKDVKDKKLSAEAETYRAVLCPPSWKVQNWQRYDDRNRKGEITKRTWIGKCV